MTPDSRPSRSARYAACLLIAGCSTSVAATPDTPDTPDAPSAAVLPDGPTYHADVAPLLAKHCVGCHTSGGVAPLSLQTYGDAALLAAQIAAATRARTMPPFLADASGSCNTYRGARWLQEPEIATFERWSAAGAPEGTAQPAASPALPTTLEGDVRSFDIGFDYLPRTDVPDDYRCFVVDAPAVEDSYFVTGFDVHPSNRSIAHHLIVFHPRNDDEVALARALDAADQAPGYACFGAAGVKAAAVAAWAPGGGATYFPDGTGVELHGGRALIVQMHYRTHGAQELPDRSRVELAVAFRGVTPGRFLPLADPALSLAPHAAQATAEATLAGPRYHHDFA